MIRIAVGSDSPLKFLAVREATAALGIEAEIFPCKAESGIPPQPYGRLQTLSGALWRADQAREARPDAYAIGIENGLVPHGKWTGDVAYVSVITPSGKRFVRQSTAIAVPDGLVEASLASGQTVTVGALEAKRSGCDPADPHRVWSNGQANRKDLLADAVADALSAAIRTEQGEAA